jgi:hypothetical protein
MDSVRNTAKYIFFGIHIVEMRLINIRRLEKRNKHPVYLQNFYHVVNNHILLQDFV